MGASQKLQSLDAVSTVGRAVALDVDYLNRATFGDKPLRGEIIGLFLSQANGLARSLGYPVDTSAWQFLAHTLKGAASAVGAKHIADIASAWEQRHVPVTAEARSALAAELNAAILAFERAASKLH